VTKFLDIRENPGSLTRLGETAQGFFECFVVTNNDTVHAENHLLSERELNIKNISCSKQRQAQNIFSNKKKDVAGEGKMKKTMRINALCGLVLAAIILSCENWSTVSPVDEGQGPISLNTLGLFPFASITNKWWYTEGGGNRLFIEVLDTITDNNTMYFKVFFGEQHRDTTTDWFRRSAVGTEYSPALTGQFDLFLPASFGQRSGSFSTAMSGTITYTYQDSVLANGKYIKKVMQLQYPKRTLHGFDELDFADSLGIISLIDRSGRFPVVYMLDSAYVNDRIYK
jgi:hypothetical protein